MAGKKTSAAPVHGCSTWTALDERTRDEFTARVARRGGSQLSRYIAEVASAGFCTAVETAELRAAIEAKLEGGVPARANVVRLSPAGFAVGQVGSAEGGE